MAKADIITRGTYVRKLPFSVIHQLCQYLDPGDEWKTLASNLHLPPDYKEVRYTYRDILVINEVKHRDSCTNALLQDWGTLNSTTGALVDALVKMRHYTAADYICVNVFKGGPATRLPGDEDSPETQLIRQMVIADRSTNSSASIPSEGDDPQPDADLNDTGDSPHHSNRGFLPVAQETRYTVFPYKEIKSITNKFDERPRKEGGNFIGKGGFGTVFYGQFQPDGEEVAVKRLDNNETVKTQFDTEIKTLLRFHHENILMIKGFSTDGPQYCILCEFMKQGSLEDRLACKDGTPPLTIMQRVEIAKGTARGIVYLHTAFDRPMVHRDIKSANILLNNNLEPRVGDFGFARDGAHGDKTSTIVQTNNVIGTGAYMAPEAVLTRDISVKLDTYSYGVILLELLTSLRAFDSRRSDQLLHEHIIENDDIPPISWADKSAGPWSEELVVQIYDIAKRCLELRKKKRPSMIEILPEITKLLLPD